MFATIATGGKQLKVEAGRYYHIDLLPQEIGAEVVFIKSHKTRKKRWSGSLTWMGPK